MQSIVSCVTAAVLRPSENGYQPAPEPHNLSFRPNPARMIADTSLHLDVLLRTEADFTRQRRW